MYKAREEDLDSKKKKKGGPSKVGDLPKNRDVGGTKNSY